MNEELWCPFQSRLDFDVASFALWNALKKDKTNNLISLLMRAQGDETVTLSSHTDMYDILEGASWILTPVGIWKHVLHLYSFLVSHV